MKGKAIIIMISILIAYVLMSGGYGLWEKTLTVKGNLKIKKETVTIKKESGIVIEDDALNTTEENGSEAGEKEDGETTSGSVYDKS